eukprot:gnl/TRDRNA2_/TRDRNA2_185997_c0_seq1.p1 gnl/TRDRNA2_/TRDRNA2_185997_c0~~gnl/TRDRNA2_/TRDRNA2_185997_c0_seq1.p1  ORF type:complete len:129 (-),score=22.42 gnl/TRDRNA2_/TRDRNA2_185997_c0_seq1:102-488(-)
MFWSATAFFFMPFGLAILVLQLSGIHILEKVAWKINALAVAVGPLRATMPMFFVIISLLSFSYESFELYGRGSSGVSLTLGGTDPEKAKRWRHERNWWIVFMNLVVWFVNWRLGSLIKRLREEATKKD